MVDVPVMPMEWKLLSICFGSELSDFILLSVLTVLLNITKKQLHIASLFSTADFSCRSNYD